MPIDNPAETLRRISFSINDATRRDLRACLKSRYGGEATVSSGWLHKLIVDVIADGVAHKEKTPAKAIAYQSRPIDHRRSPS